MNVVPVSIRNEVIVLFKKNYTVREISKQTGINKQVILEFLTKNNHWSINCGVCKIKRCYDCSALSELGRPVTIQDRVNFIAKSKNANR